MLNVSQVSPNDDYVDNLTAQVLNAKRNDTVKPFVKKKNSINEVS